MASFLFTKFENRVFDVGIIELTEKGRNLKEEITEVPQQLYCQIKFDINEAVALKNMLDTLLSSYLKK